MNAIAVEVGQHLSHEIEQFVTRCLLQVYRVHALCLLLFLDGIEHLAQRHFFLIGVHGDVGQRDNAVGAEGGEAMLLGVDALDDEVTSFTNLILECISFTQLDVNGYLTYNVTDSTSHEGYYLSKGYAVPITWSKATPEGITHYYYKSTGQELELNTGKTYIAFVPADSWDKLELK